MRRCFLKWIACGLAASALGWTAPALWAQEGLSSSTYPVYAQASGGALAQPAPPSSTDPSFEARLAAIEAALTAKEEKEKKPEWLPVNNQGWTLKVGGEIQGDYVNVAGQDAANEAAFGDIQNYFEFRRLRLNVSGTGYGVYDFKFQVDFEPENSFTVRNAAGTGTTTIATDAVGMRDMFVGIHEIPFLGYVRVGQYYEPFGLEQNTSDRFVTFMERSLPVLFARDRQVGITAYNTTVGESLYWAYGAFLPGVSPETSERVADDQGIDLVGRMVWNPWYGSGGRHLLHIGGGCLYNRLQDDVARFSTRPETHEITVLLDTGSLPADSTQRANLELATVLGPLSIQGEYYAVRADGINGFSDANYHGAYAYVSYFLTGEHRPYDRAFRVFTRVVPNTNFWIVRTACGPQAGWGAWELAARWSYVDLNDPALATVSDTRGDLHDMTLGVTWYWNPYAKCMLNYIHAFNDIALVGDNNADILGMRFQVDF